MGINLSEKSQTSDQYSEHRLTEKELNRLQPGTLIWFEYQPKNMVLARVNEPTLAAGKKRLTVDFLQSPGLKNQSLQENRIIAYPNAIEMREIRNQKKSKV